MAARTDAVGKSECPIKGCTETVEVFRYREKTPGDSTRRRFAGRLYCVCPTHKRIENQEFLLEHIKWNTDASGPSPSNPKERAEAPPPTTARPVATRAATAIATRAPVKRPATPLVKRPAAAPVPNAEKTEKPVSSSAGGWLPDFWKTS